MTRKISLFLLFILLVGCSGLKVNVGGFTHHINRSRDWNEGTNNRIRGVEYGFSRSASVEYTDFINSFGDSSQALNLNFINRHGLGIKFGIVDGYGDRTYPFFLPVIAKDFEKHSVDIHILPSVIIVFLKVKLY